MADVITVTARRRPKPSSSETKERILAAAAAVLSEEGVVGVSTRRVAERAGANQALIHYYFQSIDNLMWEVVKRIAQTAVAERESRYEAGGTFIDNWKADMAALLKGDSQTRSDTKVWFEAMAVVINTPELRDEHLRQRDQSREVMKRAFYRELIEAHPGQDMEATAETLTTLVSTVRSGLNIDRLLGSSGMAGTREMLDQVEEILRSALKSGGRDGLARTGRVRKKAKPGS